MSSDNGHFYTFGDFRLDPEKRVLWRCDEIVQITPKAVDVLAALVERRGDLLTRDELLDTVWKDSFVEEANLNFTISGLRKALGPEGKSIIETVPRRGYRFAGKLNELPVASDHDVIVQRHTVTEVVVEEESVVQHDRLPTRRNTYRRYIVVACLVPVLALLGVLFYGSQIWRPPTTGSIRSVAVLPIRSFATTSADEALSFGLVDALVTRLGKIGDIRVITITDGPTSARGEPDALGRQVGVDSVLDGTLQRMDDKLRVTLRLIRTSDGTQVWSESFDEAEPEIFRLQDRMAQQTANALARTLKPTDSKHPTENREAYQAYLRGRFFFDKRDLESYEKASAEFERAVALDPKFALAFSGLADTRAMQANISSGALSDSLYEKARELALKAVELDEGSAEAHTSLGWIKRVHDWDWNGSEIEFRRAIELDPNYVNARQWFSYLLLGLGRKDEALAEMEKARELAPLSKPVLVNYFSVRLFREENELLPQLAEQIASLDESEPTNTRHRTMAALRVGDYRKVVEIGEAFRKQNGGKIVNDPIAVNMAVAYTRTGQKAKADEMLGYLAEKAKTNPESAFRLALAYAELGRNDKVIPLLQRSFDARDDRMVWIKIEPSFNSLHQDPQFQTLLTKMRLA